MPHVWFAVALAAAVAADSPQDPERGRLCVGERNSVLTESVCRDVTGVTFELEPAKAERLFLWTSASAKKTQLGTVPAGAAKLDLTSKDDDRELRLSVRGDASRGWPADTTFSVSGNRQRWRWEIPGRAVSRLERIIVPAGTYTIEVRANRHRVLRRAQIAANEKDVTVGDLDLQPVTMYRGRVVDASNDRPLVGASVSFDDGALCAAADEQGFFRCEQRERASEALVVSAPGFGQREITLSRMAEAEVDLGAIRLAEGRTLTLRITRPDRDVPVHVTVFFDSPTRYDHSRLETRELAAGEDEIRFENLAAGEYQIVLAGPRPLERLEVPVPIKDTDVEKEIAVKPYRLEGTATFGDEKIAESGLEIIAPQHTWRHRLSIKDGVFNETMWQPGELVAFIKAPVLAGSELVRSPQLGEDPSRWDIRIAKRVITGRVLDAESREPVGGVSISVTAELSNAGKSYFSTKPQPDGTYQILANRAGTYRLRVTAPDYVPEISDVTVTAEDATIARDFLLDRGVLQELEIVTASGAPIANAIILEGVQADRVNPEIMTAADGAGRFRLRGVPRSTRLLYIIPREGSFAVVRVTLARDADAKPMQVIVPPAAASLRVRTTDEDEKPVGALLLLRYNGEFIPGAILRFVTGEPVVTGPAGEKVLPRLPAGIYELWALAGREDEVRMIASGGTLRRPVTVGLSTGEALITLLAPAPERRRP